MAATQEQLQLALEYKEKLTAIINMIHAAQDIGEILINLRPRLLELLHAERLSIFAVDTQNQQVYTLFKVGTEVREIRVPRTNSSFVGFVALNGQTVNIRDAYDQSEVQAVHAELRFDSSWDQKTGFRTRQVLTTPLLYDGKYLMGVLQLLNKVGGERFDNADVAAAQEVARTLAIAFYNRRRLAPQRNPNKFASLIDRSLISERNFEDAVSYASKNNQPVAEVLVSKYRVSKEEVLKSLATFYGTDSFVFDGTQRMPEDLRERLKADYLKKIGIAPLGRSGGVVRMAMPDPTDLSKTDLVRSMGLAPKTEYFVALESDIRDYLNVSYDMPPEAAQGDLAEILTELSSEGGEVVSEEESSSSSNVEELDSAVIRLANQIIVDGYARNASDIHIEPQGTKLPLRIRLRIDGVCHAYQEIPASHANALVSRLKIMAQLDISERRLPQDGKIRFRMKNKTIELRVATCPTQSPDGTQEDVVMRILAASKPIPLDEMGFLERNLRLFKELLDKPYGIILCVGPTGSGKTTTLHSGLGHINTPDMKIWTAEDPVEISQVGLRQVQMKPKIGFTFAIAMRSFLRADPDVIMVGEMRDQETAEIGVEASLTGHLVLSTLHTNSAPETITRLLEMGIEPFNFADALLGVLAQRLARRLCKHCKASYHPGEEEYRTLAESFGEGFGITYSRELMLYKTVGCPECAGTGYRGRVALHELMEGTDAIKRLVQKRAMVEEIRKQAIQDGMTTLMQDGIEKIFQGITDFAQVRAVCIK